MDSLEDVCQLGVEGRLFRVSTCSTIAGLLLCFLPSIAREMLVHRGWNLDEFGFWDVCEWASVGSTLLATRWLFTCTSRCRCSSMVSFALARSNRSMTEYSLASP